MIEYYTENQSILYYFKYINGKKQRKANQVNFTQTQSLQWDVIGGAA